MVANIGIDYIQANMISIGKGTQTNNTRVVFSLFGTSDTKKRLFMHTLTKLDGDFSASSGPGVRSFEQDGSLNDIGEYFTPAG
jgi:hypothetical protein